MKPYKGVIKGWTKVPCDPKPLKAEKESNLGYRVFGSRTGSIDSLMITSPVVKHEGTEIETLNSRYTLEGEQHETV